MSKPKAKAKAEAQQDDEALDDWEELFIAAIQGGVATPDVSAEAFVDWCDEVARAAQERLQRRRENGLKP